MEKTARAKGNYQDMETAKNVQRSRSLFGQFKVEGKGYSPDMSCKAKANSADEGSVHSFIVERSSNCYRRR